MTAHKIETETNGMEMYKSQHLANQALCRMFDKGQIDFDTWLSQPIKKTNKGFVIVSPRA